MRAGIGRFRKQAEKEVDDDDRKEELQIDLVQKYFIFKCFIQVIAIQNLALFVVVASVLARQ